jgi:mannose-1-phosphate guanylyltransferase
VSETLPANVMILCAGLGTRLRPLTEVWPKPLLPIGDRPQLAHVLEHLAAQRISRVVLNTHHLPEKFAELSAPGLALHVVHEAELLGTAGALSHARSSLATPLVVWNGDILAAPPVAPLHDAVGDGGICMMVGTPRSTGTLGLDAKGRVVRLRGERFGVEVRAADYIGVLGLGSDALECAPARGCLVADVCLPWLREGRPIHTLDHAGAWTDIGTLEDYQRANLDWLSARGLRAYVSEGARVAASAVLEHSIVHRGATVEGFGVVARSVVFPGAMAIAPLSDVIVLVDQVLGVSI